eukprot:5205167-Prymnesium_polylepis.1
MNGRSGKLQVKAASGGCARRTGQDVCGRGMVEEDTAAVGCDVHVLSQIRCRYRLRFIQCTYRIRSMYV